MAANDLALHTPSVTLDGALTFKVTSNSTGSSGSQGNILPGEPVTKVAGAAGVLAAASLHLGMFWLHRMSTKARITGHSMYLVAWAWFWK